LIGHSVRTILTPRGEKKAKHMPATARAQLESLLRARKLDVTLTSAAPWADRSRDVAPIGSATLDAALGGGLARGELSEIIGPRSSGRTTLMCRMLAAAAERGEAVAVIDASDRFDPASAHEAGLDLSKLFWVRNTGDASRALKALHLVLQAGGFGLVAFDVADVHGRALRQFPYTTWMRIARVIEGSQTTAVIVAAERLARSPGGVTIALDGGRGGARGQWSGTTDRARFFRGITLHPRLVGGR
jgi:recombination protein RecA